MLIVSVLMPGLRHLNIFLRSKKPAAYNFFTEKRSRGKPAGYKERT